MMPGKREEEADVPPERSIINCSRLFYQKRPKMLEMRIIKIGYCGRK